MIDFFVNLFDGSFMPHGHCLLWRPDLLLMHVGSDVIIAMSYYSIPAAIAVVAKKRRDFGFNRLFWLFSLFIFACGTTHILGVVNIWHGYYYAEGLTKVVTAAVSAITAILLWPLVPKALAIPSIDSLNEINQELQTEIQRRQAAEERLIDQNRELEATVKQRTKQLELLNSQLKGEIDLVEEKRSQLQAIMDGTNSIIFLKATDLTFVDCNNAFLRTYGFRKDEVIGRNNQQLFPKHLADKFDSTDEAVLESGQLNRTEVSVDREDDTREYLSEKYPIFDSNDNIIGIAAIASDLTELKSAQRYQALLASIVDDSMDAIVSKDMNSEILSWNPGAEALLGFSREEMLGESIMKTIPESHIAEERFISEQLSRGEKILPFDTSRRHKDGHLLDVSVRISPVRDVSTGNILGAATIIRDISERKKAEQELLKKSKALESANEALREFVYIASHDLKAPLRGINNYAVFLEEDLAQTLDAQPRSYLDGIKDLSLRMSRLLESLLAYSKAEISQPAMTKTSLCNLIRQVSQRFSGEPNVCISIPDVDVTLFCDPIALQEALANIIDNGIKYNTSAAKQITISFSDTAEKVRIDIRDNGLGIDQDKQSEIFKVFHRLHGRDQFGGGTGAGLAISKKIIERHDGLLDVASECGKGSCFSLTLPKQTEL